jgi:hypothetical protein
MHPQKPHRGNSPLLSLSRLNLDKRAWATKKTSLAIGEGCFEKGYFRLPPFFAFFFGAAFFFAAAFFFFAGILFFILNFDMTGLPTAPINFQNIGEVIF